MLCVGCDDAKVRVWDIPEGGLVETLNEPTLVLAGYSLTNCFPKKLFPHTENCFLLCTKSMLKVFDNIVCFCLLMRKNGTVKLNFCGQFNLQTLRNLNKNPQN